MALVIGLDFHFFPRSGLVRVGYHYTDNSIELLNHCEEHASENVRCILKTLTVPCICSRSIKVFLTTSASAVGSAYYFFSKYAGLKDANLSRYFVLIIIS